MSQIVNPGGQGELSSLKQAFEFAGYRRGFERTTDAITEDQALIVPIRPRHHAFLRPLVGRDAFMVVDRAVACYRYRESMAINYLSRGNSFTASRSLDGSSSRGDLRCLGADRK
jgi:hypothetical protein